MIKKTILAATVLAGLSVTAAVAQDAPPPPPPPGHGFHEGRWGPHGPHGAGLEFLAGLKLTPAQHKQIDDILGAARQAGREDWKKAGALHEQIEDLLLAPGPVDRAKLTALTQQIEAIHQAGIDSRLDVAVKIHDVLTPAQLADGKARLDKIRALHAQLRDLMGPPPGGDDPE